MLFRLPRSLRSLAMTDQEGGFQFYGWLVEKDRHLVMMGGGHCMSSRPWRRVLSAVESEEIVAIVAG